MGTGKEESVIPSTGLFPSSSKGWSYTGQKPEARGFFLVACVGSGLMDLDHLPLLS